MSLELRFLPAAEGDAIWVRWGDELRYQLLVDMGREGTGKAQRIRLEALPADRRQFELLVVTHVDADHIAGVLSGLVEPGPLEGLTFGDVWFNGWAHLHGDMVPDPDDPTASGLEPMGGAQGERLTSWLGKPWNEAFGRGPVERRSPPTRVDLPGGLRITVLGPPRDRLVGLQDKWEDEVHEAIEKGALDDVSPGLERLGRRPVEPELSNWQDLEELADTVSLPDHAAANGSSIVLLLEWENRRVLLTGDAWAPDVLDGLRLLDEPMPISLDVVKLAHHGSEANTSDELVEAITCPRWVISTNGARFYHPDAATVARLLRHRCNRRPELLFNVPSPFNRWWDNRDWQARFDYTVTTGADPDGITVNLQPG